MPETLIRQAQQQGIAIEVVPFIKIVPRDSPELRQQVARLTGEPLTALFTSTHSVLQVKKLLEAPPQWTMGCLEGNTQKEAIAFFGEEALQWTAADAAQLATKINAADQEGKMVFFCGDRRMDYLPEALKKAGKTLEEVVVYETHLLPVEIMKDYDAVLFFSPSAVESFFSLNTLAAHTIPFVIGNTTAQSLKQYTPHNIIVSPAHQAGAMIEQLIAFYNDEK